MPFLAGLRTKARVAFEEKKETTRTALQKWAAAKPQEPKAITKRAIKAPRGMITGGLFVNGAGMTGQLPRRKKKVKKSKAAITIQLEGKTLKVSTGTKTKAKKRRHPSASLDIMNVKGGILG